MFKKTSFLSLVSLSLSLSACQLGQKKDCSSLNWRAEGEALALSGEQSGEHLKNLSSKCRKYSGKAETINFSEGFQRGLAKLCKTDRGFDFGLLGKGYKNTCPNFRETNFLKGYYKGRIEFLNQSLQEIEDLYRNSEGRVWRKEQEYTILRSQDPERAKLEADVLESYREEARSLAGQVVSLKRELLKTKKLSAESFF